MDGMNGTDFFRCDHCHMECRIYSETPKPSTAVLVIRRCRESVGIVVLAKLRLVEANESELAQAQAQRDEAALIEYLSKAPPPECLN